MRQGLPLRVFFWCIVAGAPLLIGVVALLNPPSSDDWWVPWVLAAGFTFAGGCGLLSAEYVYVSESAVRKVGPFLIRRHMPWENVSVLDFDESGSVYLDNGNRLRIAIPADLCGIAEFPDVLESRLPEAIREEHSNKLQTYRRFIGPVDRLT